MITHAIKAKKGKKWLYPDRNSARLLGDMLVTSKSVYIHVLQEINQNTAQTENIYSFTINLQIVDYNFEI